MPGEVGDAIARSLEGSDLLGDAIPGGDSVGEGWAVLAEEAFEAVEALLDFTQSVGIGLGACSVTRDLVGHVREGAPTALEGLGGGREGRVELRGGAHFGGKAGELVAQGTLPLVEARGDALGGGVKLSRMAKAIALGGELVDLALAGPHGVDGLELKREEGFALAAGAFGFLHIADLLDQGLEALDLGRELAALVVGVRELIEVAEVGCGIGQGHAVVLGGDVGELGGERGQLARGAEPSVDVGAGLAGGLHDATDDEFGAAGDALGLELFEELPLFAEIEEGLDVGFAGAGPYVFGAGAATEDKGEGADDD